MTEPQTSQTQQGGPQPIAGAPRPRGPSVAQIGIVVAILAVAISVTGLTSDITRVSEPGIRLVDGKPSLPDQAGEWIGGKEEGLSEMERTILPADTEGTRRSYHDAASNEVYCSVILAGKEVTSIHRPELCLPGQGWKIESEYTEPIQTPDARGGVLHVMRMNTTRTLSMAGGQTAVARFIFVYWFVGKDRVTPYHWQRILWTAQDRVLHNRNHRWAYILIEAPSTVDQPGTEGRSAGAVHRTDTETMQVVARFVQGIYPKLAADSGG